jgi:lipid II:glycine glycyltransferase (peptidoglycan interpeptide bridge formation enzyme)
MKTKEIGQKKNWDEFLDLVGSPTFLQSWEWGEFQKDLGYPTIRIGILDDGRLIAIGQIIKIKAKRGNFLFIPQGPLFKPKTPNNKIKIIIKTFINYLEKIAKKEACSFIRISPILINTSQNQSIFKQLGFKNAPIYMHAETIWQLPLTSAEEIILANMRKTTRYLIKKAIRENVVVEKRIDDQAIDDFYQIYEETARRENFIPFSKEYIQKEFAAFKKTGNALFLFAKIEKNNTQDTHFEATGPVSISLPPVLATSSGLEKSLRAVGTPSMSTPVASALIIFTKSTAFYHQGASFHTKVPATYLLQWEAIKEAKKRGCSYYNFWGIYDEQNQRTPKSWQGLTLFKTGFGGEKVAYLPTQDYIINPFKYQITFLWEKLLFLRRKINE